MEIDALRFVDVPGWEGLYRVSPTGEVWSVRAGRRLRPGRGGAGYPTVALARDSRAQSRTVHSLVAEAFLGPRPAGFDVCHIDGDRANPALSNLRYASRAANCRDRVAHGTNGRKLDLAAAREIRRRVANGETRTALAREYGIAVTMAARVAAGEAWHGA